MRNSKPQIFIYNINGSNHNIISNCRNMRDISQSQNSYNNSDNENFFLKKEIEFLRSQLEFTQNLLENILKRKGGANA